MASSPQNDNELLLAIGKVQGTLEAVLKRQGEQTKWSSQLDERLRHVEKKSARNALISGGLMAVVIGYLQKKMGF